MALSGINLQIENLVAGGELNYIEAVLHFCEENNIEIDEVADLIDPILKEKLKTEFVRLNYFSEKKIPNQLKDFFE
jgi:hypothetical protein